ncbi:thiol reductase thioredoxin [Actinoplanes italicus]|uniref:Thioredoxin n=1 Tax=Actinoplanes italicus TaxID=113567 RepID=A0A2T0KGG4_9ACTN|nr:thioredoxin [Actinoplanes italicus]GIE36936.1 thiol reductase thioredoxin [Actinoplanes italicus]
MSDIVACVGCGQRNRIRPIATGTPVCGKCRKPLPWITVADDVTFAGIVEQSPLPVVVDLWAAWCMPCRMVGPALEQVARDLAGRVKLVKVDVDRAPVLSRRFAVQAVPTLLVMKGGEVEARQSGAAPAAVLRRWVEQALSL